MLQGDPGGSGAHPHQKSRGSTERALRRPPLALPREAPSSFTATSTLPPPGAAAARADEADEADEDAARQTLAVGEVAVEMEGLPNLQRLVAVAEGRAGATSSTSDHVEAGAPSVERV